MKKVLNVMGIIVFVIIGLVAALLVYNLYNNYKTLNKPRFQDNYYQQFTSDQELERKYAGKGDFEVTKIVSPSDDKSIKNIRIWYPDKLTKSNEVYPLIVVVNGSQCPAKTYEPFFARLASWGFVVVGNDDPQAGTGDSTSKTLDFVLKQSEIKAHIDVENIGIIGYSQGGAGAINAVTEFENSNLYKALFTGSAAYPLLASSMKWEYDESKIQIPYFMTAGTGKSDDMGVADINKEFGGLHLLHPLFRFTTI